jgi:hypothetical protein
MPKTPIPMTIGQVFQALTRVLKKTPEENRQGFKKAWLNSVHWFDAETEWMRQERLRKFSMNGEFVSFGRPTSL